MRVEKTDPVSYTLCLSGHEPADNQQVALNPYIGQRLRLRASGEIRCLHCQRRTKTSFNQGYCYPCFKKLAQCDRCIMSPELCHFDLGTCREPDWGEQHCMQSHIVYLANSSGIKVGITRHSQIPTRWIDQGAIQALPIVEVSSRHLSGLVEVILKQWVSDRTNWRKMLKHEVETIDLHAERDRLLQLAKAPLADLRQRYPNGRVDLLAHEKIWDFAYPARQWPDKIKTYNLEKQPEIEGTLIGIKGQYLIFDTGCFNVRKHTSYEVSIFASSLLHSPSHEQESTP